VSSVFVNNKNLCELTSDIQYRKSVVTHVSLVDERVFVAILFISHFILNGFMIHIFVALLIDLALNEMLEGT
jgi:hypothetical protein